MLATQISLDDLDGQTRPDYLSMLRACGVDILLISMTEFFCEGEERAALLRRLADSITFFENNGLTVYVWTNSLGYGIERGEDFYRRFSDSVRLTNFSGETGTAVCTLDERFTAYMRENVRDIIRAGARCILWDDDLVQSVRPGFLCSCEKHLKKAAEKTGTIRSREEIRQLFTGKPTQDRGLYMDAVGESLLAFCRAVRRAADEVDASVHMGLCASYTHFDADGVHLREILSVLTAEGQKPLLRLSGAPYWACFAPRYPGQNLQGVFEFVKMQHGWYADGNSTLLDENDCYPRDTRVVPASFVELYDKVMITLPEMVRHKYILCFRAGCGDDRYMRTHIRNREDDRIIAALCAGLSADGLRIYQTEHKLRDAELPEPYPGDGAVMGLFSQPFAGIFAAMNGIPTKYAGTGAGIVFGENARYLTDAEIGAGLLLDMKAALFLRQKGVDVGFSAAERIPAPSTEIFPDAQECITSPDGTYYAVRLCAGAEKRSVFRSGNQENPACWTYTDRQGRRFAVFAWDADTVPYGMTGDRFGVVFSDGRHRQMRTLVSFVSGKEMPVYLTDAPGVYIQALSDAAGDNRALVLCNCSADAWEKPEIYTDEEYSVEKQLDGDRWTANGRSLSRQPLPAFSYSALRIRRKKD